MIFFLLYLKTRCFLWHLTGFRSANHIGGLMLVPRTPLIYRWKFIKIYKNASHMWLVLESGLDLTIAPLVIWSVGSIMPLHQIQSTPDMSRMAVKSQNKKHRRKEECWKRGKKTRNRLRGIIFIISKQDKRSTAVSSGLLLIKRITLSFLKKWNESAQYCEIKIGTFHESVS